MPHSIHAPPPALAPFVEELWIQEEPAVAGVEPTRILPVGAAGLVLEFGDPYELVHDDGRCERLAPLLLTGQLTGPKRVRALGATGLVIVRFRPWGAAALLGPQEDCRDRYVDARALVPGALARRVHEELGGARDSDERVAAVERFLLELRPRRGPDLRVRAAVALLQAHGGRVPIERVADELGLGRRHLARLFARALGLGPKAFARIVRFQAALGRARAGASWGRVAPAAGYADQAHLVKECVSLTGCTPTELLGSLEEREVARRFNTRAPSSVTYL